MEIFGKQARHAFEQGLPKVLVPFSVFTVRQDCEFQPIHVRRLYNK